MKFFGLLSIFIALAVAMEQKAAVQGEKEVRRHHRKHQADGSSAHGGEAQKEHRHHRRHHHVEGQAKEQAEPKAEQPTNKEITNTAETALAALKRCFVPSKITTDDPAGSFSHITEVFNNVKREIEHKHNTVNKLNSFLSPEVKQNMEKIMQLASESMKDDKLKQVINDPGNREAVKKTFALFKSEITGKPASRHHHRAHKE